MKKTVALLVATLLALTACGGSSAEEKKASENIAKSLRAGGSPLSDADAACFADKFVARVGITDLKKYGVLDDDLEVEDTIEQTNMSAEDADGAADAFTECVDIDTFLMDAFGASADEEVVVCLSGKVSRDTYHDLVAATFTGGTAKAQETMAEAYACMMEGPPG